MSAPLRFDLLDSLEARLQAGAPRTPMTGVFCVGIQPPAEPERWLHVVLGDRVQMFRSDRPAPDADALLLLGARDAEAILVTGKLPSPASLLRYGGDRKKMDAFLRAYLKP